MTNKITPEQQILELKAQIFDLSQELQKQNGTLNEFAAALQETAQILGLTPNENNVLPLVAIIDAVKNAVGAGEKEQAETEK